VRREGFNAVLVATGASLAGPAAAFGEARGLPGFVQPVAWLRQRREGPSPLRGGRVVIDGATAQGIQWAVLAALDGAREVTVLTPLPGSHLPLEPRFTAMAEKLGVKILCLHEAHRPVVRRGRLVGLGVRKLRLTGTDSRGRPRLEPAPAGPLTLSLDAYVPAGPRMFDRKGFESLKVNDWGLLTVNAETMMADPSGIFAAGDGRSGGRRIVESIASGRRAAAGIRAFLSGAAAPEPLFEKRVADVVFRDFSPIAVRPAANVRRSPDPGAAILTSKTQAMAAARRCLRCGACTECMTCHHFCRWTLGTEERDAGSAVIVRLDRTAPGLKDEDEALRSAGAVSLKAEVN